MEEVADGMKRKGNGTAKWINEQNCERDGRDSGGEGRRRKLLRRTKRTVVGVPFGVGTAMKISRSRTVDEEEWRWLARTVMCN